jgi:hypothetical protein
MQPKTKSQIWRMRARELRDAAADAHDPVARDTYLSQARKFARRARRENIVLQPVDRTAARRNPARQHEAPFPTHGHSDRMWPWVGAVSLTAAAVGLALLAI